MMTDNRYANYDEYGLRNLPHHLAASRNPEKLQTLRGMLLDYNWLYAKLNATDISALLDDYELSEGDETIDLVRDALRLSAHILTQDKSQLAFQLLGRLLGFEQPEIKNFLEQIRSLKSNIIWLRPITSCLPSPGGALIRTLISGTSGVNALAVTPDGKHVISGSGPIINVWDWVIGEVVHTMNVPHHVTALAVTPDGKYVISGSDYGPITVLDLKTGRQLHLLEGHNYDVQALVVTPDSKWVISGSRDWSLKVWDIEMGKEVRTLGMQIDRNHWKNIEELRSKAQELGADDRRWDFEPDCEVLALALIAGGKRVISYSRPNWYNKNPFKEWDLETGNELRSSENAFEGVGNLRLDQREVVTSDGKRVITASNDGTIKIWDLEKRIDLQTQPQDRVFGHLKIKLDGRRELSGSADKYLKLWDTETGRKPRTFVGHTERVTSVALSADGKRAISGSEDMTLKLWDVEKGRELRTFKGHTGAVSVVSLTVDGGRAISSSYDRTLKLWNLKTGRELRTFKGHTHWVNAVALSADGKRAISGSEDKTLKLWDMETGRELRTFVGHTERVTSVALSVDGKWALSGSRDATLKLWDTETGRVLSTFEGSTRYAVSVVALTADGGRALSASGNEPLTLWDVETGRELRTFVGHTERVTSVALSVDGKRALSGSEDNTLKLWDVSDGNSLSTTFLEGNVTCVTVSSKGKTIVAGDEGGNMYFLKLEGDSLSDSDSEQSPIGALNETQGWLQRLRQNIKTKLRG